MSAGGGNSFNSFIITFLISSIPSPIKAHTGTTGEFSNADPFKESLITSMEKSISSTVSDLVKATTALFTLRYDRICKCSSD